MAAPIHGNSQLPTPQNTPPQEHTPVNPGIANLANATLNKPKIVQFPYGSHKVIKNGQIVDVPNLPPKKPEIRTVRDLQTQSAEKKAVEDLLKTVHDTAASLGQMADQMEADVVSGQQMLGNNRNAIKQLDKIILSSEAQEKNTLAQIKALKAYNKALDQKPTLPTRNWKLIAGASLCLITLIAIAAIFGLFTAAITAIPIGICATLCWIIHKYTSEQTGVN